MCGKNDVNNILCVCGVNSDCICNIDHNKSLIDTKNNNNDSTLNISKTSEIIVDDKIQIKPTIMINTNNNNNNVLMKENSVIVVKRNDYDILSIAVQWTRRSIQKINRFRRKMQRSRAYKIICRTTQPTHIISVGILSFVLLAVWPNILQSEEDKKHLKLKPNHSSLTLVTYLGSFAAHFGAQIWMTFVSGLSLYFALPRHTFGLCQQILFPKYFAMNSILSIYTLIMFIKMIGGKWEYASRIQVIALTVCAVIEVFVRLYLAPPLLRLMKEKHKFESSTGSGKEIGYLNQGGLVRCPHYQKVHKSFRKIHMLIAIGNITTLLCTFLHLHYLASKIRVS